MAEEKTRPFTILIELIGTGFATVTCSAHCEKCAFTGTLEDLAKKFPDMKIPVARVIGMFEGHHENIWPKIEKEIGHLAVTMEQAVEAIKKMRDDQPAGEKH